MSRAKRSSRRPAAISEGTVVPTMMPAKSGPPTDSSLLVCRLPGAHGPASGRKNIAFPLLPFRFFFFKKKKRSVRGRRE